MPRITAKFVMPVRDLEAATKFYIETFHLREMFRGENIVFVGMPGSDTSVGLRLDPVAAGSGPQSIGFRLDHAFDREQVLSAIEAGGGKIVEQAEHAPGIPYARITDPDGNELEL